MMTPSMRDYNDDGKPTGSWQTIKHYNLTSREQVVGETRTVDRRNVAAHRSMPCY